MHDAMMQSRNVTQLQEPICIELFAFSCLSHVWFVKNEKLGSQENCSLLLLSLNSTKLVALIAKP